MVHIPELIIVLIHTLQITCIVVVHFECRGGIVVNLPFSISLTSFCLLINMSGDDTNLKRMNHFIKRDGVWHGFSLFRAAPLFGDTALSLISRLSVHQKLK